MMGMCQCDGVVQMRWGCANAMGMCQCDGDVPVNNV